MSEEQRHIVTKLIRVYEKIDHVDKAGHNKNQNYDFVRAADVVRVVRAALIEEKIYAEINFTFEHPPYTIAREKAPNAPFSAVNVRCFIVFHDQETGETITSSGLGTGADTGDKSVYKAQTGALKYALKQAALLPDEADPEADESVDEQAEQPRGRRQQHEEMPDFQEAQKATPRPTPAAKPVPAEASTATQTASSTAAAQTSFVPPAAAPSTETTAQAVESTSSEMPTEEEMKDFRVKFARLGDDLSTKGKLKASKSLPVNRKILVFLLHITKAADAKSITKAQWTDFFERVNKCVGTEENYVQLAQLVNKTNGVEEKA